MSQHGVIRNLSLCLALVLGSTVAQPAAAAAASVQGQVQWPEAPRSSNTPQSEAQKEAAKQQGRILPMPELLQPTLDPALPAYVPSTQVLRGSFSGGSSDVLVDLVGRWFARFRQYHPQVQLKIEQPFAGSLGTKELIKDAADFVFVSRELKPEDLTEFDARFGYAPTSIPIAAGSYRHYGFLDAMAFFVHPDNPLAQLSYAQIDAIFSSTRHRGGAPITHWGQLGLSGEWADKPIKVFAIKPWNGFEEFIRQRILDHEGKRGEWRQDLNFEKLVFPLASQVAADRYALGYSGLAYIDAPVRVLPLQPETGGEVVAPSYENVATARYPLGRLVYFNVNKAPGKPLPAELQEFLSFVLSQEGQAVVREQGVFLPLREAQATHGRRILQDK